MTHRVGVAWLIAWAVAALHPTGAAAQTEIATLQGHTDRVFSVAFSPDRATLASGGWDNTVKLWDINTRQEIATLPGHTSGVFTVAFSPDGATLASGSADDTVKLWDVNARQEIATLQGHSSWVYSVAFSPDGATLASGSLDSTVKLWDINARQEVATLQGHLSWVNSVAFSPDGATLASGSDDSTVKLWDVNARLAGTPTVSISPTSVALPAIGQEFTMTLRVMDIQDLLGWEIDFVYDNRVLRFVDYAGGDFLTSNGGTAFDVGGDTTRAFGPGADGVNEAVNAAATKLGGDPATGSGDLGTITFEVLRAGTTHVRLDNAQFLDGAVQLIPVVTAGATLTADPGRDDDSTGSPPTVSVAPSAATLPAVGQRVSVTIDISNVSGLTVWTAALAYNSAILRFRESADGGFLSDAVPTIPFPAEDAPAPGDPDGLDRRVSLGAVTLGSAVSGSGSLATVTFDVVGRQGSTVALRDPQFSDATGAALQVDVNGGTVTLDTVAPNEAPIAAAGSNQAIHIGDRVSLDGTASTDDVGVVAYSWNFGDGSSGGGARQTHVYHTAGTYTVTLEVTDASGASGTDTLIVEVQPTPNEPPAAAAGSDQTVTLGDEARFDASASTDDNGIVSYSWSFGDGTSAEGARVAHTFASAGTFSVTLTVADTDGAVTTDVLAVAVEPRPNRTPVAIADGPPTVQVGEDASFDASASNDDGRLVSFSWDFGDGGADAGEQVTHVFVAAGTFQVTLYVTDNDGAVATDTRTVTVVDGNNAPVFGPIAAPTVDEGVLLVLLLSAADPNGDVLTYEAVEAPDGSALDAATGRFEWTPGFDAAGSDHSATFRATDGAGGEDTLSVTITVADVNRPPSLERVDGARTVSEGDPLVLQIVAADPDGDALTYTVLADPVGSLDGATGRYVWTPGSDDAGLYTATFIVTDRAGAEDRLQLSLRVNDNNREPVFRSVVDQVVTQGETLTFTVAATDPDGDALTYFLTGVPVGATFDAAARLFAWTPDSTDVGATLARFTVSDSNGGTDTLTVQITVEPPPDTTPPEATMAMASAHVEVDSLLYTAEAAARFNFDATDDRSDPEQITVRVLRVGEPDDELYSGRYSESQEFVWTMGDGDGTYGFVFTFTDAAGNTAETTVTVVLDTTPPTISGPPLRTHTEAASAARVDATVTDASSTTGTLYYRSGGAREYQTVPMEGPGQAGGLNGETRFSAAIRKGAMQYGAAYYVEFTDVVGNQATFPDMGAQSPSSVVVRGTFGSPRGTLSNMWAPASVPLKRSFDLRGILDGSGVRWAAGKPDGTATLAPSVQPGYPIWLFTEHGIPLEFEGTTADLVDSPRIQLTTGWNLVASPYLFPVPFGNLRAVAADGSAVPVHDERVDSLVRPRFWQWVDTTADDRNDGHYRRITDFNATWEPWSGYWLFANGPTEVFLEPFTALDPGVPQSPVLLEPEWYGGIVLADSTGGSAVTLAVARETEDGYGALDIEQPPRMGALRLSLMRNQELFQQLAKPSGADEWVWDAALNAPGSAATIRLLDSPPQGNRLYLEDLADGSRQELRPGHAIDAGAGVRQVRLRLTQRNLGWDLADVAPSTTELLHNYPNPFNPETWIPFALSTESDVTIAIYDIAGGSVRSLALGRLPAGRHSQRDRAAYWDGRDATGAPVASGVYVYELRAGTHRQTRRLVVRK